MRAFGKILLLALPAVVLALLVLELGGLRLVVPVDDVPIEQWDASARLIKYRPNQQGVTFPDGDRRHPVRFTINADGWNSVHPAYTETRRKNLRIAVIGDSYVAAFQVEPRESVSGRLEELLSPERAEVYSFGMNGAPLSQYLHVARYVIGRYEPDAVVLVLVHNDFDESYRHVGGRYTRSFLRLDLEPDGVEEVPPVPYEGSPVLDWIRMRSATFRFFFYRLRIGSQQMRDLYLRLFGPREPRYEANVDVGTLEREEGRLRRAARYVFDKLAGLQQSSRTPIVLLMDTPRDALYRGHDPSQSDVSRLNRLAADLAAETGIKLIDLTDPIRRDWKQHRQRFDFPADGHWNARAHSIAAREAWLALRRSGIPRPERDQRPLTAPRRRWKKMFASSVATSGYPRKKELDRFFRRESTVPGSPVR